MSHQIASEKTFKTILEKLDKCVFNENTHLLKVKTENSSTCEERKQQHVRLKQTISWVNRSWRIFFNEVTNYEWKSWVTNLFMCVQFCEWVVSDRKGPNSVFIFLGEVGWVPIVVISCWHRSANQRAGFLVRHSLIKNSLINFQTLVTVCVSIL